MLGAIIGDTVGSIYEFRNIRTTDFPLFSEGNSFTDDSVMTMAVAEWLLHDPTRSQQALEQSLVKWGHKYPDAGYGGRFMSWLFTPDYMSVFRDKSTIDTVPSGIRQPYNSFGNGSAMRASACGWVAHSLEEALDLSKRSAMITHNHPEGIKGAQATAAAIFMARRGDSKEDIYTYIKHVFNYDLSRDCDDIRRWYSFDETCQGTMPAAFAAFFDSYDFESAIRLAVSLGGDSDTIACITGGIAEAYYKVIPADIIYEMRKRLPADWWHIIWRIKAYDNHHVSPADINSLRSEEIFVFGSNKNGWHSGGAAAFAHEYFQAEWGVGEGITGKCYALPTMEGPDELEKAVAHFTEQALADPNHNYLVTPVGCGIAGYSPETVAPMFMEAASLPNVYLPQCFWDVLDKLNQ